MNIRPEPRRIAPLVLPDELRRLVVAGRVRLLALHEDRHARLGVDDLLWLREALMIPAQNPGADRLALVHAGDRQRREIRWPRALARPGTGILPAAAMPVQASRLTLLVRAARTKRLQAIDEDEAIAAGVTLEPGGFGNPLASPRGAQVFASAAEAFGRMWDAALAAGGAGFDRVGWEVNPEVRLVEITAIARNVADLVPGLGSGGVR